jgi:hypothetical protein
VNQQLGLTKRRDWAGRTGKAGPSRTGQRLAFFLSIGIFLVRHTVANRKRDRPSGEESPDYNWTDILCQEEA